MASQSSGHRRYGHVTVAKLCILTIVGLGIAVMAVQPCPSQMMTFEQWAKGRTLMTAKARSETLPVVETRPGLLAVTAPVKVALPQVSEADFQRVMDRSCGCHRKEVASVAAQVKRKWIVPGQPESSKTYTFIGVHKRPGGKYHNLSDADKKIVGEFIAQMKK